MSLDDMIHDEELDPPTVCDQCAAQLGATDPSILGWQMLVFTCVRCKKQFCSHLESKELACVDCAGPEIKEEA